MAQAITDPDLIARLESQPVKKDVASVLELQAIDAAGKDEIARATATGSSLSEAREMRLADFTAERQRSATQEPAFRKLAGATIPTLAGVAGMIPGVGLPAAAAISGIGTAANQVAGFEEPSLKSVAISTALPLAAKGVVEGVKGSYKAAGKFFHPSATRTAGVEAAVEQTGAVPNAVERAYSVPGSKAAYELAAQQGPVPIQGINKAIVDSWDNLTNLSNAPRVAVRYLENLSNKYAGKPQAEYADLMDEMQMLKRAADKAMAQKDRPTASALYEARAKILDEMDKVSPAIKEANTLYRREQSVEKIAKVLSNPRPDVKISQLLIEDPLSRGAFSKDEAEMLDKIAKQIATMGTQAAPYSGATARVLNLVSTPVAAAIASPPGRYLMRQTFKDGQVTPAGIATLAQFGRAYIAQGQQE